MEGRRIIVPHVTPCTCYGHPARPARHYLGTSYMFLDSLSLGIKVLRNINLLMSSKVCSAKTVFKLYLQVGD